MYDAPVRGYHLLPHMNGLLDLEFAGRPAFLRSLFPFLFCSSGISKKRRWGLNQNCLLPDSASS